MTLPDLILIAVGLSMDAFAVSVCKGLSVRRVSARHALLCGVWFGGFQALMPLLGFFLGDRFASLLTRFGPWIAFVLLALIGGNMIKESFGGDETLDDDFSAKAMLPLASALRPCRYTLPRRRVLLALSPAGCPLRASRQARCSATNTAPRRSAQAVRC